MNAENARRRDGARARRAFVARERGRGRSFRAIGRELNVSRQRAHQLFVRAVQEEKDAQEK